MTTALDIPSTYSVSYMCSVVSAVLFGVSCIQTFSYFQSPAGRRDGWSMKSMVILLTLLDITHQIIVTDILWYYLIINFGRPETLLQNIASLEIEIVFNGIIAAVVESAWVMRLCVLSKDRFTTFICALLAPARFLLAIMVAVTSWDNSNVNVGAVKFKGVTASTCFVSVVTLGVINGSLCYYLWIHRSGFHRSGDIINKHIMLIVASRLLTTLVATGTTISVLAAPHTQWETLFSVLSCKCYINAYLTSLNARDAIRNSREREEPLDVLSNSLEFCSVGMATQVQSQAIAVTVRSEVGQDVEASGAAQKVVHIT